MNTGEIQAGTVQNETSGSVSEKAGKQQKSAGVLDGPTHLYKHYDKNKRLLYVGISLCALQRLIQHRNDSEWFDEIHTIVVEKFPTRTRALKEETKLIKRHKPPFNKAQKLGAADARIVSTWKTYEGWTKHANEMVEKFKAEGLYTTEVQDEITRHEFAVRDAFIEAGLLTYPPPT